MTTRTICAVLILVAAPLTLSHHAAADDQSTAEKLKEKTSEAIDATKAGTKRAAHSIAQTSRHAWKKTKAYFSEDTTTYREGADQQLIDLRAEISRLKKQSANVIGGRDYFATRVRSLEEQDQYINDQLAGLAAEDMKSARESKRSRLNQTIERLEENIALAQKEVQDFTTAP